jgi:hypothetical protein
MLTSVAGTRRTDFNAHFLLSGNLLLVYAQPAGFATLLRITYGTLVLMLDENCARLFVLLNKQNGLMDIMPETAFHLTPNFTSSRDNR